VGTTGADIVFQVGNNGATEAARIFNNGNVSIGSSSAISKLYVASSTNAGFEFYPNNSAGINLILNYDRTGSVYQNVQTRAASHQWLIGSTEAARIDSASNFGIGTNSPGVKLEVAGAAKANYTISSGALAAYASSTGGLYSYFASTAGTLNAVTDNSGTAGTLIFATGSERMRITSTGNVGIGTASNLSTLTVNGSFASRSPSTVNAATYSVAATDGSLRFTTTNNTLTLPSAASFPGRILYLNTITANSVTSASSNVIPLGSNTAGTAILAATAGKFAMLQSDGTNWITMLAN
jgi:hypothetical protein